MKNKILPIVISLLFLVQPIFAQHILNDTILKRYSKTQLDSIYNANSIPNGLAPINYSVSLHRVTYSTRNAQNTDTTIATGLMVVPDSVVCPLPIASYDHGTTTTRYGVPSYLSTEALIGIFLGANGYLAVEPDYLGLGGSPGVHPYIHAKSEATATIDLIRAAKSFCANNDIPLNGQLFLTGYSQGGHACMATHREIETNFSNELTVTASAPGSGPYNVSGVQARTIVDSNAYSDPSYLPYIILGYQYVYGNLYTNLSDIFVSPYDTLIPHYFDGTHSTGYIDSRLPSHPNQMIDSAQFQDYLNDSINNPLRIALRDNDVYQWVPQAPIKMTYCEGDEQVFYQNSLVAYNYFTSHGATNVQAVSGGASNDHGGCVTPALLNIKGFFDSFRKIENNLDLTVSTDNVSAVGDSDGVAHISVVGDSSYTIAWSTGSTDSSIMGLPVGSYTVTVTDNRGCPKTVTATVGDGTTGIGTPKSNTMVLTVYPNPASNELYYDLSFAAQGHYSMDLFDMAGNRVYQQDINITGNGNYGTIDLSQLSTGIYCLKLTGANQSISKRVAVVK